MKRNDLDTLGHAGYRSCARKKRYKTEDEARKKAKEYEMQYYHCEICGGYHLTKQKNKNKQ